MPFATIDSHRLNFGAYSGILLTLDRAAGAARYGHSPSPGYLNPLFKASTFVEAHNSDDATQSGSPYHDCPV
jgi:hypothetical protein